MASSEFSQPVKKNVLAVRILCIFLFFSSRIPSRLNKPKDATDMTSLTGILTDYA